MNRRLSILDRGSMHMGGHEHTQLRAWKEMARDADFAVVTNTQSVSSDATAGIDIRTLLQPRRNYKRLSQAEVSSLEIESLTQYVESVSCEKNHVLVVPGASSIDLRMLLTLSKRQLVSPIRLVCRVLRLDIVEALNIEEVGELAQACRDRRLILFTETDEMKLEIQSRYGIPVAGAMLLPCMIDPGSDIDGAVSPKKKDWSVAFFGAPREEKGSKLQPLIFSGLREFAGRHPLPKTIRVFTQGHRLWKLHAEKMTHNIKITRERLINRTRSTRISIELGFDAVPDERFAARLSEADLIVLPYMTPPYDTAGSGLVIDGVLAGKAILHSAGMAMKDFLSCGNAESARSPEEFSFLIVKMLSQLDKYSEGKVQAKKRLISALERTKAQVQELLEAEVHRTSAG